MVSTTSHPSLLVSFFFLIFYSKSHNSDKISYPSVYVSVSLNHDFMYRTLLSTLPISFSSRIDSPVNRACYFIRVGRS